jgi:hypothetical protein
MSGYVRLNFAPLAPLAPPSDATKISAGSAGVDMLALLLGQVPVHLGWDQRPQMVWYWIIHVEAHMGCI